MFLKKDAAKQSQRWCEKNIADFMTAFAVCVFYIIQSCQIVSDLTESQTF